MPRKVKEFNHCAMWTVDILIKMRNRRPVEEDFVWIPVPTEGSGTSGRQQFHKTRILYRERLLAIGSLRAMDYMELAIDIKCSVKLKDGQWFMVFRRDGLQILHFADSELSTELGIEEETKVSEKGSAHVLSIVEKQEEEGPFERLMREVEQAREKSLDLPDLGESEVEKFLKGNKEEGKK